MKAIPQEAPSIKGQIGICKETDEFQRSVTFTNVMKRPKDGERKDLLMSQNIQP